MEASSNLIYSSPQLILRTQTRNCFPSSTTTAASTIASIPTASTSRYLPTKVVQRDEDRPPLNISKEKKMSQEMSERGQMDTGIADYQDENFSDGGKLVEHAGPNLLHWTDLWKLFPTIQTEQVSSLMVTTQSISTDTKAVMDVKPFFVLSLAKKALLASKQAALLAEDAEGFNLIGSNFDESLILRPKILAEVSTKGKIIRSARRLKRRVTTPRPVVKEAYSSRRAQLSRSAGFDTSDPLRLFLWGPETKQLLTADEESGLIAQIQNLIRLEEVKKRLQWEFGREPTLAEWGEATGLKCKILQSYLRSGKRCRDKLIYANLRMVVHIAKQYQGRGLSLQDLLQEGSMGLMKSVEKFKPQAGCRFGTYAYWWIRQTIAKAILRHSRTIRLPENVYFLLNKVREAKTSYAQEGNHDPTKEELSRRVGIKVEKLEKLLSVTRQPLSMQQAIGADQDTTFQEITADTQIEIPHMSVAKQLMRQHVRNLLDVLNQRERQLIRLRYGIGSGKPQTLSEIGKTFGVTKERVRQMESQAMYKLKQRLGSQELEAYTDLLV